MVMSENPRKTEIGDETLLRIAALNTYFGSLVCFVSNAMNAFMVKVAIHRSVSISLRR